MPELGPRRQLRVEQATSPGLRAGHRWQAHGLRALHIGARPERAQHAQPQVVQVALPILGGVGVGEHAHRGQIRGVLPLLELGGEEQAGLIVAEGREGRVERIRQHAELRALLHPVVDHVAEHVAVEHVALAEQQERAAQRQRAAAQAVDHDVAGDALSSVTSLDDRLGDGRVRRLREVLGAAQAEIREQRVELRHHHAVVLTDEGADGVVDPLPVRERLLGHQGPERVRTLELPAVEDLAAVLLRLQDAEVDAPEPHHGAEVLLELREIGVVPARLELREVQVPLGVEQHDLFLTLRGDRLVVERLDLCLRGASHRIDELAAEQAQRHGEVEVGVRARLRTEGAARALPELGAHVPEQARQRRDQRVQLHLHQERVVGLVNRVQDGVRRHVHRQIFQVDGLVAVDEAGEAPVLADHEAVLAERALFRAGQGERRLLDQVQAGGRERRVVEGRAEGHGVLRREALGVEVRDRGQLLLELLELGGVPGRELGGHGLARREGLAGLGPARGVGRDRTARLLGCATATGEHQRHYRDERACVGQGFHGGSPFDGRITAWERFGTVELCIGRASSPRLSGPLPGFSPIFAPCLPALGSPSSRRSRSSRAGVRRRRRSRRPSPPLPRRRLARPLPATRPPPPALR